MTKVMTVLTSAISATAFVLLIGCGAEESQVETQVQDAATEVTEAAQAAKAYPLDFCIISGEKLGSMGDPVVKTYAGHEIKFCCAGCIEEFESNVPTYLAKIDSVASSGHEGHDHDGHDHDGEDHSGHNH